MRLAGFAALLLAAALALAGCDKLFAPQKTAFNGVDVTGAELGPDFVLKDPDGKERRLADFRGKAVTLFFGYTQCPDVCPTTLSDMARTMQILGADAERVQVLFVTIDPKRDTPALLKQYVPAFNPNFIGLWGDPAATAKVTRDFKIYAQERAGKTPESYTMDHSAQMLVFDPKGRVRLVFGYGMEPEKMAADIKVLLNS
jgi:protein SCO1